MFITPTPVRTGSDCDRGPLIWVLPHRGTRGRMGEEELDFEVRPDPEGWVEASGPSGSATETEHTFVETITVRRRVVGEQVR